jgi:hypothetical protein
MRERRIIVRAADESSAARGDTERDTHRARARVAEERERERERRETREKEGSKEAEEASRD